MGRVWQKEMSEKRISSKIWPGFSSKSTVSFPNHERRSAAEELADMFGKFCEKQERTKDVSPFLAFSLLFPRTQGPWTICRVGPRTRELTSVNYLPGSAPKPREYTPWGAVWSHDLSVWFFVADLRSGAPGDALLSVSRTRFGQHCCSRLWVRGFAARTCHRTCCLVGWLVAKAPTFNRRQGWIT